MNANNKPCAKKVQFKNLTRDLAPKAKVLRCHHRCAPRGEEGDMSVGDNQWGGGDDKSVEGWHVRGGDKSEGVTDPLGGGDTSEEG